MGMFTPLNIRRAQVYEKIRYRNKHKTLSLFSPAHPIAMKLNKLSLIVDVFLVALLIRFVPYRVKHIYTYFKYGLLPKVH